MQCDGVEVEYWILEPEIQVQILLKAKLSRLQSDFLLQWLFYKITIDTAVGARAILGLSCDEIKKCFVTY